MKRNIKYRPNKAVGVFSVVWGCVFILIGLLVAIPVFGAFGLLWTVAAIAITVFNAFQAFGKKYMGPDITVEDEGPAFSRPDPSFDPRAADHEHITEVSYGHTPQKRLEQLETLREAGLIDDEEYREKRKEILSGL